MRGCCFQEVNANHWLDLSKQSDDACNFILKKRNKTYTSYAFLGKCHLDSMNLERHSLREIGYCYVPPSVWPNSTVSQMNGSTTLCKPSFWWRKTQSLRTYPNLGGGFKYFLYSPRNLVQMNPFWRAYFSIGLGWNHQLETLRKANPLFVGAGSVFSNNLLYFKVGAPTSSNFIHLQGWNNPIPHAFWPFIGAISLQL